MNCPEWEEAIALYAGGDLDARRSVEVERHLAVCAGCQIFASGIMECLEAMKAGHRQEISGAHYAAVRARVLAKLQPAPWWRRRWVPAAALAAAACCAWWLAMVNEKLHQPVPPPQVALARPPAPPPAADPARTVPALPRHPVHPPHLRKPITEEPLTVRMVTDDPNVVIYWITNPKGE